MESFTAVILAAGEGTRMKSDTPKVLHKICGKPMLAYVIEAARGAGAQQVVVIVGKAADRVKEAFDREDVEFVLQEEQKGTGHALMQAEEAVKGSSRIVVLCGDMPLVTAESIREMVRLQQEQKAFATVMTAKVDDPTGYGRIIRKGDNVVDIREHKDASPEERKINEINAGIYCFDTASVFSALAKVKDDNIQGEYYLTDVVKILYQEGKEVIA
ncbi:MAG: NTP transferase domain-containing protein, partial [Tepidanaerobacteraceae bacterium]